MKKELLRVTMVGALAVLLTGSAGCGNQSKATIDTNSKAPVSAPGESKQAVEMYSRQEITSGAEAQQLLTEGNKRYINGKVLADDLSSAKRDTLKKGQKPFAIILSCADSRVPPEVIFDQGLGDVFVIRDAGNVADPVVTGSVEYGAEHLKAPLLVVLGHSSCGAVTATAQGGEVPGSIGSIIAKIKPSVEKAKAVGAVGDQIIEKAAELNVEATMAQLETSPVIKELVEKGKLTIVGAKYNLETGEVGWLSK